MRSSQRITELDGIRGLACLFVLIHHYFTGVNAYPLDGVALAANKILAPLFLSGVDLFYVLSGFLVGGIIIDHYRSANFLRVFFVRRICRIFPVYFALMLSFVLGLVFFQGKAFFDIWLLEKPLPLWTYFTFVQSYAMGLANFSGPKWVAVSWSVSVEEQFYLLTPMLFLLFKARGVLRFVLAGLIVAPFLRIHFADHYGFYAGYMMFPGRFDTILWGVLLAYLMRNESWRARLVRHATLVKWFAAGIFLIISLQQLGYAKFHYAWFYSLIAMFYACVLFLVLESKTPQFNRLLNGRFLTLTGFISYGMYMYHQLVNGLVHGYAYGDKPVIDSVGRLSLTIGSVVLIYALSYLSYRYFETPIRRWGAQFRYRDRIASAPQLLPKE